MERKILYRAVEFFHTVGEIEERNDMEMIAVAHHIGSTLLLLDIPLPSNFPIKRSHLLETYLDVLAESHPKTIRVANGLDLREWDKVDIRDLVKAQKLCEMLGEELDAITEDTTELDPDLIDLFGPFFEGSIGELARQVSRVKQNERSDNKCSCCRENVAQNKTPKRNKPSYWTDRLM